MICRYCNKDFEEKKVQDHHVHPRFMDNKKGEGMKIPFCDKCHNILHLKIPSIIWRYVSNKDDCINAVVNFTLKYGGKDGLQC